MTPKDFFNHSGGARGADMMWDTIGRKYGFINHKHWRPEDAAIGTMIIGDRIQILKDVKQAADALGRPSSFKGIELVYRNWFQVYHSEANIYAIAPIIEPRFMDMKGFVNNTGKPIVSGGTGWAVEMAIQKKGRIHVFDRAWYIWDYYANEFTLIDGATPILTPLYAGIGSRIIPASGITAIEDVYKTTLQSLQKSDDGEDTNS